MRIAFHNPPSVYPSVYHPCRVASSLARPSHRLASHPDPNSHPDPISHPDPTSCLHPASLPDPASCPDPWSFARIPPLAQIPPVKDVSPGGSHLSPGSHPAPTRLPPGSHPDPTRIPLGSHPDPPPPSSASQSLPVANKCIDGVTADTSGDPTGWNFCLNALMTGRRPSSPWLAVQIPMGSAVGDVEIYGRQAAVKAQILTVVGSHHT